MSDTTTLSPAPPQRTSQRYTALRERGLQLIGQLASDNWTDHNIHDPGITFLEAFIYALTDIGFRTQLEIKDLLKSGEKYALPKLPPAHQVLPAAPITAADLRQVLLDHYLLRDASTILRDRNEIALYQNSAVIPPLSFTATGPRIPLAGLFETFIEFRQTELNSNTYLQTVAVPPDIYSLDIALPHWDETESLPFRETVTLTAVTLLDDGSGIWRPLTENRSYFAEARIDFVGSNGATTQNIWLVARIADVLAQPPLQIPIILAAAVATLESIAPTSLVGLYLARVLAAHRGVEKIRRYLLFWRNLAQVPQKISVVRQQEIAVAAQIEVNNGIDLELLLAKIFASIDAYLSPPSVLKSLNDLRNDGLSSTDIFVGPLLRHGFIAENNGDHRNGEIFTSDILRLIMRERGGEAGDVVVRESINGRDILTVSNLTLSNFVNNRVITKDARDCLRLVEVERYRARLSPAKSRVIFLRDDIEIPYDFQRVLSLFESLLAERELASADEVGRAVWPVPAGQSYPTDDYYPFQNELPRLYGVGPVGLPDGASTERKVQALQTKGYLLLAEQFLGDASAQLANINRFFSPDSSENQSYFSKPLYEVAGISKLIKQFPEGGDWSSFVADLDNAYARALQEAIEQRSQFIDRRNRLLDQLLAREGMEMLAWSQELHRFAYQDLKNSGVPPLSFPAALEARRLEVNEQLITLKAKLLADAPRLNATRLQAFGALAQKINGSVEVVAISGGYLWRITLNSIALIEASIPMLTMAAAQIAGEDALLLATNPTFYTVVPSGGERIFQLLDGTEIVGHSVSSWPTLAQAQLAANNIASQCAQLSISYSITPFEQLLAHQCGTFPQYRRRLLAPVSDYFEVYDELDADGIIEKRWRLWSAPSYSGNIRLSSVFHFTAPPAVIDPLEQEAAATALALAAIASVIRYGVYPWNYVISPAGPNTYNFDLRTPQDVKIALYIPPLPTLTAVQSAINASVAQLQQFYSAEGFHLLEHLLLRPQNATDPFLTLPLKDDTYVEDPYSQRLSLVFPSGYARDFGLAPEAVTLETVAPHRFRDREFRKYAQRVVEQHCPAHLLPTIYWVDQQLPGSGDDPASFNQFENRYFAWLQAFLIPGTDPAILTDRRNQLIESLNGIAND